jgi:hypothetical protein
MPPTDTPTRILATLIAAERDGRILTVREIQSVCYLSSTSVVQSNMRKLAADGDIRLMPRMARGYQITAQGRGLPSDAELLQRCLNWFEQNATGGRLIEDLRARLCS